MLKAAGLDPDKDIDAGPGGIDTMPELLESGEIDAFFWSGGLPTDAVTRARRAASTSGWCRWDDLVEKLHAAGRGDRATTGPAVMPADAYPEAQDGRAVQTVAVANLLVTTDRTDAELTEGFTRTVINSRDRIGSEVHAAQLVDLRTAIYTDPLALHEGAAALLPLGQAVEHRQACRGPYRR